jgi:molecular chaperone HtpG
MTANSIPPTNGPTQALEMTFDFDGLIQLLAGHLYSEKKVFARELIQNAHDAIVRRAAADESFERTAGRIDVLTDITAEPATITFRDNGIGMTRADLVRYLATIGASGTRRGGNELPELIGQFGIGFLSGFVVGGRVEVRTRHWEASSDDGCLWENDGSKQYTIGRCIREHVGTEVIVYLRSPEDRGLLHEDSVKRVIRDYADMLRIPVYLNDPKHLGLPENTRVMPWEKTGASEAERRVDCFIYLERTVPDSVLEVIPIQESTALHAEGLLYITKTRVFGIPTPRTIRVFQKRMFLCEDAKDLLPPWATFVNGIINTTVLSPNAARDNFARDENFSRLRDRFGDLIVRHFEWLRDNQPKRLSEILVFHDLAIKAACHYYDEFFDKFGYLLQWHVNGKSPAALSDLQPASHKTRAADHGCATLSDVLRTLNDGDDGKKRLACFTTPSSANQYFEMADASGTTVVDASSGFEGELIAKFAASHADSVRLVFVDRENDPAVFREIDPAIDSAIDQMARRMAAFIRPGGTGRLRVEAKRFEPAALPAILKDTESGRAAHKARMLVNDPNAPAELRSMAEEMLRLSTNADMWMTINAANPLIRSLASLSTDDSDARDLLLGIYNDAILYNQDLLTAANARIFHEQFQRLLARGVDFVRQREEIRNAQAALAMTRSSTNSRNRTHLVGFFMTPFSADFARSREALRIVIEERLRCELRTADERTFEDFIHGNIRAHMDDADFYVADVTGANPNVMLELGAALYSGRGEPTLLIARVAQKGDKPLLPVDLEGYIAGTYFDCVDIQVMAETLEETFLKHVKLRPFLEGSRERYVSPAALREASRDLLKTVGVYDRLSERFPTESDWNAVVAADLQALLGQEADLREAFLKRIHQSLKVN